MQSQDSINISKLLNEISVLQLKADDKNFYAGTFPSFRENGGYPHNYVEDYNIFYSAVIAFSLKNMLPNFSDQNKLIAEKIISNVIGAYPHYQNIETVPFYNFWPRGKKILPNTYIWQHITSLLDRGDDADDTAIMLMSMNADSNKNNIVKSRMIAVSNLATKHRRINTTKKKYSDYPAYSTYFGIKSPPDFDFGVHCNILYFMLHNKLPFVKQDTATILLLQKMIGEKAYLKFPLFISPYYATPPILLYHVARLMGKFKIPELEKYRSQIIDDLKTELDKSENILDRILISTSLLRMGEKISELKFTDDDFEKISDSKYAFFQARAAYNFPTMLKKIFLHFSYINYYFYCPAFNKMLLLEYLVERNKK